MINHQLHVDQFITHRCRTVHRLHEGREGHVTGTTIGQVLSEALEISPTTLRYGVPRRHGGAGGGSPAGSRRCQQPWKVGEPAEWLRHQKMAEKMLIRSRLFWGCKLDVHLRD